MPNLKTVKGIKRGWYLYTEAGEILSISNRLGIFGEDMPGFFTIEKCGEKYWHINRELFVKEKK